MLWLLIWSTAIAVHCARDPHKEAIRFCEAFVQCSSVALLEERLCLGNTLKRPYWLPDSRDKHGCHQKLRNDYILLEKMEEKSDSLMTACLVQNTIPFTTEQLLQCNVRVLKETAKFSFGHSIYYVPNHCFTGVERRRERQCGAARMCCPALSRCATVPGQSELVKSIEETKINMRKRAKDCENGIEIEKLVLPLEYIENQQQDAGGPQHLKVNISQAGTRAEQEPKADKGANTNVSSSEGSASGYEINPSGYEASYPAPAKSTAPSDKGTTQTPSSQAASSAGSYDGSESVGQVSNPVRDEKNEKVNFPQISDRGSQKSELKEEDGSLTISSKPKLSFPYDRMAVSTSQGVIIVNFHDKDSLPDSSKFAAFRRSNKSHDELFEHAMKNTNEYKAKIEQLNRGEAARKGLDSLLKAGQVFSRASTHGVVAPGSIEPQPTEASGSVRQVDMTDEEDDDGSSGEFVTSAPVIFVAKNETSRKTQNRSSACTVGEIKAQTKKLQVILALLGEKEDSDDMKEIKKLIKEWQDAFKHGVLSLNDKTTKKEIKKALEDLISKFDRVNLMLVRNSVLNGTIENDMTNSCDPVTIDKLTEIAGSEPTSSTHPRGDKVPRNKSARARKRIDDLKEHVIVEDGVEKLILSGSDEDVAADLSVDSADASIQVDEKPSQKSRDSDEIHDWSNEEYKRELEKYKKEHQLNVTTDTRNETSCDLYMRCRNQMHLAVDSCAWRFASSKILPTLAESAESLLYKGDDICDPAEQPLYEELYELVIKRNTHLRGCLDKKNAAFFATSVCLPYSSSEHVRFNSALLRLLTEDYKHSSQCFRDANLIQEKCTKLRECCPNFDSCRQETMDITLEQAIISKTAQLNEDKQNCLKEKAREAFKTTLRGLLGRSGRETLAKLKRGELSSDIARGAQALARLR